MDYFTDESYQHHSQQVKDMKATQDLLSKNELICPLENNFPVMVSSDGDIQRIDEYQTLNTKIYLAIFEKEAVYTAHSNYWRGATMDKKRPPLGNSYKKIGLVELGRLIKDFNVDGINYYRTAGNFFLDAAYIAGKIQENERKLFETPEIRTMQSLHLHMMACDALNMWDSREWFTLAYAIDNVYKTCDELTRDYIFNQWKEMAHGDYETQRNLAIALHDEVLMSEMYTQNQFDIDEIEYINRLGTRIRAVSNAIIDFGCIEKARIPKWFEEKFSQYAQHMKNQVQDKCLEMFRNAGLSPFDALLVYHLIYEKQKEMLLEIYCIEKGKKIRPYDNHLNFTTEEINRMFYSHDFKKRHEVLATKIVEKFQELSLN